MIEEALFTIVILLSLIIILTPIIVTFVVMTVVNAYHKLNKLECKWRNNDTSN